MSKTVPSFVIINLRSEQASQFLQGQITADIAKITQQFQLTSICNLKGRVNFGFWIAKVSDTEFNIVISADCSEDFMTHVKKYGAFSRIILSEASVINPTIIDDVTTFTTTESSIDVNTWLQKSIEQGQWIITHQTREKFQPQELRLHQLGAVGGVHYDKGCYLGQEVVARIWFKSSPKAWLHRVQANDVNQLIGDDVSRNIKLVNYCSINNHIEALVVATPNALADSQLQILELPDKLKQDVARKKAANTQ